MNTLNTIEQSKEFKKLNIPQKSMKPNTTFTAKRDLFVELREASPTTSRERQEMFIVGSVL